MGRGVSSVFTAFAVMIGSYSALSSAVAGEVSVRAGNSQVNVALTSIREARFKTVIRQQYDFSCGAAAVASLLTYHYGRPTTEQNVFRVMWQNGDQASIRRLGFSLLDMKAYLATRGLRADGFRISLDQLRKAGIPAITLISIKGYRHFVVVKGMRDDKILVGDPALGVNIVPRKTFEQYWEGIVFVIRDEVAVAKRNYNAKRDWAVRSKAPFGTGLRRNASIGGMMMLLPGFNEF